MFCDFGKNFKVFDNNGEPPIECILSAISKGEEGIVTVHDDQRHDLEDGDHVTFAEIEVLINAYMPSYVLYIRIYCI